MKNAKKRIAIIGTTGVPARYGGFETLAHHLVLNLGETYDMHVYASTKLYAKEERVKHWNKARVHYVPLNANGVSSIPYDILSMAHAILYADYIVILGVSGGLFVPFIKWFTKKKVVVNIDGLEWRRNKWSRFAKWFLKWSEKVAVKYSDADITDNESIKVYTAKNYKTASHLIAYGADHTSRQELTEKEYVKYPFIKEPYAFKVARIEPENNLDLILNAFSKIPHKQLVIVGNWKNSDYGKNLKNLFEKYKNIHLLDPIYNQKELDQLRSNCNVYVHGHSAGGTNPSLVEAMYLKLPVLAFNVSFNKATMKQEGLFFRNEKELIDLMQNTSADAYAEIADKLYKIAMVNYTWHHISQRYAGIIESFDFAYEKPNLQNEMPIEYPELLERGYAHLDRSKLFYESSNS
ncbi:DUF1972 domain-containing protein [Crocinitomix catalasitica]|uniref:DUF1972 domain-containing protein n=1 Tax=Crocinitomix catalasitica TaxID=184607 RepID=UPI000562AF00|nr:DUF1972 domain-containing protein [Crocinitomix catalasitica]